MGGFRGHVRTSVFDLPQFKNSPRVEDACSVVVLEGGAGEWVGVLRVMDGEEITAGRELEVIAISQGEASYADFVRAFEERVDFLRRVEYKNGGEWLIWGTGPRSEMALRPPKTLREMLEAETHREITPGVPGTKAREGVAQSRPQDLTDAFYRRDCTPVAGTYKFYNVMWGEWEDKVAYRRAVGRVRKEAWDKYCGEPTKIILG